MFGRTPSAFRQPPLLNFQRLPCGQAASLSRNRTRAGAQWPGVFRWPSIDQSDSESPNPGNGAHQAENGKKSRDYAEVAYLTGRMRVVTSHFPSAIGIDDFLHRTEIALYAYGFNGDNSIGTCLSTDVPSCIAMFDELMGLKE